MDGPLGLRIARVSDGAGEDDILNAFLAYVAEEGVELYPAQEEAILEIYAGKNVILNTPTGSGKSLVALAMHFRALCRGERAYYTSPIKALASEKFFQLARALSPDWVGMTTGDASVNRDAPVVCCTAEVLANVALAEGRRADVDCVVMDEFHYYADKERGVAWQVPLLVLEHAQFLLMSATLGPTERFEKALRDLTGRDTVTVRSTQRPVPLDFRYAETALHETIQKLLSEARAPIYLVNFTQRGAAEEAQNLMSIDVCSKEEKKAIAAILAGARFDTPAGKDIQRYLRHGIGIHHAGLLPKYRLVVEKLAQAGLLKVISGTDTLGVGVNVPIRTVLFTKLCKFDGEKTAILSARDFHQISGRAGRKGFDDRGSVVAQAPEHVIENIRMESKAGSDPAKKRKIVKKKPPERGYVHWDKATFERLITAQPEPLVSRFRVTHAMVLDVLTREEDGGFMALARLIARSHERDVDKRAIGRTAIQMVRSLMEANILVRDEYGFRLREGLQHDFSMHHTLALYLWSVLPEVKEKSESYALDVLSLVEAIAENPDLLLDRQLDKMKKEKMGQLKAAGVEFDARIEELEKMDYPKPNSEFIYGTFNTFAAAYPWASAENVRPKGIAREMVEGFFSFNEYVRELGVERAEGLLLRYLSEIYKILAQTVPEEAKSDEVRDLETFFGAIIRAVDSSLVDEWERMRSGGLLARPEPTDELVPEGSRHVMTDPKAFTVLVRNAVFACVRAVSRKDSALAAEALGTVTPLEIEKAFGPYFDAHPMLLATAESRKTEYFTLDPKTWVGSQILLDAEDAKDWVFEFRIDRERSIEEGRAVVELLSVHG
jgi:superfamily II RNA helicase